MRNRELPGYVANSRAVHVVAANDGGGGEILCDFDSEVRPETLRFGGPGKLPQNLAHPHSSQVLDPFGATENTTAGLVIEFSQTGGDLAQCN